MFLISLGYVFCTLNLISGLQEDGEDYNYDEDYNDNSSESYEEVFVDESVKVPVFLSTPKTILVNEGNTIKLPCILDELDNGLVVIWKRGSKIIALGNRPYEVEDKRIRVKEVKNGNIFVIMMAEEKDAGKYTCQVSTKEAGGITHEVKIRSQPSVVSVPSNGLVTVQAGESAELGCEVTRGSPEPELSWKRKERRMSSGEETLIGKKNIKFLSATRHHSGIYICLAKNGWGTPAMAKIRLDVQHAPDIEDEQMLAENSDGGHDLELTCTVHASPVAKVTWEKDGEVMINKDNVITVRGNKYSLLLHEVYKVNRSGTYTCKAVNDLGDTQVVIEVSAEGNAKKIQPESHQHKFDTEIKLKEKDLEPDSFKPETNNIKGTENMIEKELEEGSGDKDNGAKYTEKEMVEENKENIMSIKTLEKPKEHILDTKISEEIIEGKEIYKSVENGEIIARIEVKDVMAEKKAGKEAIQELIPGSKEEDENISPKVESTETETIARVEDKDIIAKKKPEKETIDELIPGSKEEDEDISLKAESTETKKEEKVVSTFKPISDETNGKNTDIHKNKNTPVEEISAKTTIGNPKQEKSTQNKSATTCYIYLQSFVLFLLTTKYLI